MCEISLLLQNTSQVVVPIYLYSEWIFGLERIQEAFHQKTKDVFKLFCWSCLTTRLNCWNRTTIDQMPPLPPDTGCCIPSDIKYDLCKICWVCSSTCRSVVYILISVLNTPHHHTHLALHSDQYYRDILYFNVNHCSPVKLSHADSVITWGLWVCLKFN